MIHIPATYVQDVHVLIQGDDVAQAREKAGLSQTRLAALCGWAQASQSRLERPGEHRVDLYTYRRLQVVLNRSR
ncbi:MAG TPA: XRE family transcriptional regulator [Phycisphaerales bacterium]|nr:XRE family transcriptional regulator [Phycisphaerales bacterium]